MKHAKILALVLCLCMIVSMFAACGGNTDNTGSNAGNQGNAAGDGNNDQYIDSSTGEIINIGSKESMKTKPEEIGTLANPVVRACEAYPNEQNIKWKEEAYGLIYQLNKLMMSRLNGLPLTLQAMLMTLFGLNPDNSRLLHKTVWYSL